MPAAAVIPAPIAYIKIVAVKKLVVGFLVGALGPPLSGLCAGVRHPSFSLVALPSKAGLLFEIFYFEKIRVFKAGLRYEYISME